MNESTQAGESRPPSRKKRALPAILAVAALAAGGALIWHFTRDPEAANQLTLYGNVELREVSLPFNNTARIETVLVEEGDRVQRGQVLARLDTGRLVPAVAQAEAQVAAQRHALERLRNGTRPEEIAQARANRASAEAEAINARQRYERLVALKGTAGVSRQDLDNARAALDAAEARLAASQQALELALAGPRQEDIAEAEARLRAAEANLALLREQLADAELVAPVDAVVRSRLMEPGEMASPQRPVFTLAVMQPKWVRTFVAEPNLGKVRPGAPATVSSDSFPERRFDGNVGYVSSVAEFTPKTLQTEELRTSLVYEVRVRVDDPANVLRLGMPVTVRLPLGTGDTAAAGLPAPERP